MSTIVLSDAEVAFARDLAPHVLWASKCNNDEPSPVLTLEYELAVALVLRNKEYIEGRCGCSTSMAYSYVCKGRVREHADEVEWIDLVRDAIEGFNREAE